MKNQECFDYPPSYDEAVILSFMNLLDMEKNNRATFGYLIKDKYATHENANSIEQSKMGRIIENNRFSKCVLIVLILELVLIICLLYHIFHDIND